MKSFNVDIRVYVNDCDLTEEQLQDYFVKVLNSCDKINEINDYYIEAYERDGE